MEYIKMSTTQYPPVQIILPLFAIVALLILQVYGIYINPGSGSLFSDKDNKIVWDCNYTRTDKNQTLLTNRARQCHECFSTNITESPYCWQDLPHSGPHFSHCGFMGDEVCTCVQEWQDDIYENIWPKDGTEDLKVVRTCMRYDEIQDVYGLTEDEVRAMGCERVSKDNGNVKTLTCFCEADKCNRDAILFPGRASQMTRKGWMSIIITLVVLYAFE